MLFVYATNDKEAQNLELLSVNELEEWGILYYITDSTVDLNVGSVFNEQYTVQTNDNIVLENSSDSYSPGYPLEEHDLLTTGGLDVTGYTNFDWSDEERVQVHIDDIVGEGFTNLEVSDYPTYTYNDIAYAWYDSTAYWITPFSFDSFYNDPHCEEIVNEDDVMVGDIVTYWSVRKLTNGGWQYVSCLHSGKIHDIKSDGTIVCKSKWDEYGLYVHDIDYVLRDYKQIIDNYGSNVYACFPRYFRYTQGEHESTYTSIDAHYHREDCEKCLYSEYVVHNNKCMMASTSRHCYICNDCGYSRYEPHRPQYTVYSDEKHEVRCRGCGYTTFADHNLYMYEDNGDDPCTVMCRDCNYTVDCAETADYENRGAEGHYITCHAGCFELFEPHVLEGTNDYDKNGHVLECRYCGYLESGEHKLYTYAVYEGDGGSVIKCRACDYTYEYQEDPEFWDLGIVGHSVDAGSCHFIEPHHNRYSSQGFGSHRAVCEHCGYNDELSHEWFDNGSELECIDCVETISYSQLNSIGDLTDEELAILVTFLPEDKLEAFISLLPEADLARVTALLPRDDEKLLTE